jgi:hypothetical protein
MQERRPSTLPRKLQVELRHSARPGRADEAIQLMERYERARTEGRNADARRVLERVKQAAPRSVSVRERLGMTAFADGDYHEATQHLMTVRRLTGSRAHDPVIAECYRLQSKPARAVELLADLPKTLPPRVALEGVIVRARALADTGRTREAVATLEKAMRRAGPTVRARLERESKAIAEAGGA